MAIASPFRRDRTAPSVNTATSRLAGKTILCVDDDPFIRRVTIRVLSHAGATCLLASTHDQAVSIVEREPQLSAAILDFQMSDGDVGQLVERLRSVRPGLTLIGTSGSASRSEFVERGVTTFLAKPWTIDCLVQEMAW